MSDKTSGDTFRKRRFSTLKQLFFSDNPGPLIQCCVDAVVCAVDEIEKSTFVWGRRREKGVQYAGKSNFTFKCVNTLPATENLFLLK